MFTVKRRRERTEQGLHARRRGETEGQNKKFWGGVAILEEVLTCWGFRDGGGGGQAGKFRALQSSLCSRHRLEKHDGVTGRTGYSRELSGKW